MAEEIARLVIDVDDSSVKGAEKSMDSLNESFREGTKATENYTDASGELRDSNGKLIKSTQKVENSSKSSRKALSAMATGGFIVAAAAAIKLAKRMGELLSEMTELASAAEEINSKFTVVFDGATDGLHDLSSAAEETSERLQSDLGLAASSAEDLLSSTGDMLNGFGLAKDEALEMADAVIRLGADLASFNNLQGGTADATDRLTKGLLGERDALKAMGIAITEAGLKQFVEELQQATGEVLDLDKQTDKMRATLLLAQEQSVNAIGDIARTFDEYANVSRRVEESSKELKETIGGISLEAKRLGKVFQLNLTKGITESIKSFDKFIKTNEGVKRVIDGVTKSVDSVKKSVQSVVEWFKTFSSESDSLSDALDATQSVIESIAGWIGLVIEYGKILIDSVWEPMEEIVGILGEAFEELSETFRDVTDGIANAGRAGEDATDVFEIMGGIATIASIGLRTIADAAVLIVRSFLNVIEIMKAAGDAIGALFRGDIKGAIEAAKGVGDAYLTAAGDVVSGISSMGSTLATGISEFGDTAEESASRMRDAYVDAASGAGDFMDSFGRTIDGVTDSVDDMTDSVDEMGNSQDALNESFISGEDALKNYTDALQILADLGDVSSQIDLWVQAYEEGWAAIERGGVASAEARLLFDRDAIMRRIEIVRGGFESEGSLEEGSFDERIERTNAFWDEVLNTTSLGSQSVVNLAALRAGEILAIEAESDADRLTRTMEATQLLANAGDLSARLELLESQLQEELALFDGLGIDATLIEEFYQNQKSQLVSEFHGKRLSELRESLDAIYDLESGSLEERRDLTEDYYGDILDSSELTADQRVAIQAEMAAELANIDDQIVASNAEAMKKIAKQSADLAKILYNATKDITKGIFDIRANSLDKELAKMQENIDAQKEALMEQFDFQREAHATFEEERQEANEAELERKNETREIENELFNQEIQELMDRLSMAVLGTRERAELEEELTQKQAEQLDSRAKGDKEYTDLKQELDKKLSDYQTANNENLLEMENSKNAEIIALEEMLTQTKGEEEAKRARAEKTAAIFDTIINTSVAIMKGFAQLGPIFGAVAAIATTVVGAVQVAAIASKPIPSFQSGVDRFVVPQGFDDDNFSVGVSTGETVSVGRETEGESGDGGGQMVIIVTDLNEELFRGIMQEGLDNHQITVPKGVLTG